MCTYAEAMVLKGIEREKVNTEREKVNTERERKRAEAAEARVRELEALLANSSNDQN